MRLSDISQIQESQPSPAWADIALARGGDGDAYARVIERYQSRVARLLRRVAHDRQSLEELVHDVFVDAYFALGGFKGTHGEASFIAWLSRMAIRRGYRYLKERAAQKRTAELPDVAAKAEAETELDLSVEQVLGKLSPRDRMVVTLLYLDEKSVAEAADLLGWSQTMVKVQAFRARGKLRKLMKDRNPIGAKDASDE